MGKRNYKLPYIPDRNLYLAVIFACQMIRENGYFHKDAQCAAKYYDVNPDDVEKYVRIAQGNGQKKENAKHPERKYHWFAVEYSMGSERNGCDFFEPLLAQYAVARGLKAESVQNRLSAHDDYTSEYAPCHWFGRIQQFDTEEEAFQCISKWEMEYKNNGGQNE